jgi:tetratricopeptide (TPR) repeat protein
LEEVEMRNLILLFLLIASLFSFSFHVRSHTVTALTPFQSGVSAMQQGAYKDALSHFTQAIHLQGNMAGAYSNRCLAHIELENYPEAIADCSKAVSLHPLAEAYLNRGMAHYQLFHFKTAIADFTQAISIDPDCAEAYLNRGISRTDLGELAGLDDLSHSKQLFTINGNNPAMLEKISNLIWQFQQENSRII